MHISDDLFEDDIFVNFTIVVVERSVVILQSSLIVAFIIFDVIVIVILRQVEEPVIIATIRLKTKEVTQGDPVASVGVPKDPGHLKVVASNPSQLSRS